MVVNATTSERLQTEPGVQSLWEAETVGRELRCLFHEQNKGHMMVFSLLFEVVMGQPILIHTPLLQKLVMGENTIMVKGAH